MSRKPFLTFVAIPAASVLAVLGITACGNGSSDDATVVQAAAAPHLLKASTDHTPAGESERFEKSVNEYFLSASGSMAAITPDVNPPVDPELQPRHHRPARPRH